MISLYISGITRILYKQLSSSFRRLGEADRLLTTENRYQIVATYKWKYISMSDLLFKHCLKFLYLLLRILRPAYVDYQDQRTVIEGLKTYGPFRELDGSTEMSKQPSEQNSGIWGSLTTADFSVLDSILAHQQPEFSASYSHNNLLNDIHNGILNAVPSVHAAASNQNLLPETKKRKEKEQSSRNSRNISSMASTANSKEKNSLVKGRKGKDKEKEVHKAEQVIHVRTKRGQATDSHSIAERVRREKIKSKLRCLQDLVPGCHKSMGMAVMLEEIINYVHSLQNQVEFLSMQLGAAACSYDQNLETLSSSKAQGTNSWEAQEMQKLLREQYHSAAWPL